MLPSGYYSQISHKPVPIDRTECSSSCTVVFALTISSDPMRFVEMLFHLAENYVPGMYELLDGCVYRHNFWIKYISSFFGINNRILLHQLSLFFVSNASYVYGTGRWVWVWYIQIRYSGIVGVYYKCRYIKMVKLWRWV